MVEGRGLQAVEAAKPLADGARDGVPPHALAEHPLVEGEERVLQPEVALVVAEVAVDGAGQLVGGAVLMHQPRHLARMPREIRRELRADHQVDGPAVALGQVEQPPRRGVREDFVLRIPLEGQRHPVGLEAPGAELIDELADQQLGAAPDKRYLGFADENGSDTQGEAPNRSTRLSARPLGERPKSPKI